MRPAQQHEKEKIIAIIIDAIELNPKIQYLLGNKNFDRKVKALARFIYSLSNRRQAIHVSEDGNAVLIFMPHFQWSKNWKDILDYCKMFVTALEWKRLFAILKMEKELEQFRPNQEAYLYVWVLGTIKEHKGGPQARALRDALFDIAQQAQLPIYAETAFDQNYRVYQRFGFEAYHTQHYPNIPLTIRFLKKEVS